MLDSIPTEFQNNTVFRFASYRGDTEFMEEQGYDQQGIAELTDMLQSCGALDSLEELCDAPFRPKRRLWKDGFPVSRFSDGSFAVFYCSTEPETAEAEVRHHYCAKYSGKPSGERPAWHQGFTCDFDGSVKDLRKKQAAWPDLTHDSEYQFCNKLGAEAKKASLDALLAPSARHNGGTNVPVFVRSAIGQARDLTLVQITRHPPSG